MGGPLGANGFCGGQWSQARPCSRAAVSAGALSLNCFRASQAWQQPCRLKTSRCNTCNLSPRQNCTLSVGAACAYRQRCRLPRQRVGRALAVCLRLVLLHARLCTKAGLGVGSARLWEPWSRIEPDTDRGYSLGLLAAKGSSRFAWGGEVLAYSIWLFLFLSQSLRRVGQFIIGACCKARSRQRREALSTEWVDWA